MTRKLTSICTSLLNGLVILLLCSVSTFGQADTSIVAPATGADVRDSLSPVLTPHPAITEDQLPGNRDLEGDSTINKTVPEPDLSKKDLLLKLIYKDSSRLYTDERIAALQADLMRFDGKQIRNITVRRTDMFAPAVMDTGFVSETWLQRTGNNLHTDTRDKIIRRNILVHPGDRMDALLISENERIIRSLPYIMDARFLVRILPEDSTAVDIELLVKDLWPVGFGLEISDINKGNAGLWNANILGLGHQFKSTIFWNGDHHPVLGYDLYYGISNLSGSFISTQMEYLHRWNVASFRASIGRDFKSTGLKYAGAARLENTSALRDIPLLDTCLLETKTDYTLGELWAGRLFSLNTSRNMSMPSIVYLSGGISRLYFRKAPDTDEHYLYEYHDKTQLLFSLGYSRQGFRKDNHIYTFERTEDVPFGYLLEIISGVEWGQYKTRPYVAGSFSAGNYINGLGYLYGIVQYGTFFNRGATEQGLLNVKLRYFTDLHSGNRFDLRGFASLSYQHFLHPFQGEYISLENGFGIKGLSSASMRGDEKVLLSLESVVFSPLRLLGFRFIFFASADMGLIWNHGTSLTGGDFFDGLGLGIRIRNDKLVFDTFEIKFSFYPGMPKDARARYWYTGSVPNLRLTDFYPGKPAPLHDRP